MKERPILFSTHMVQAILSGTKTQTRRALKIQPKDCTSLHLMAEEICEWRNQPMRLIPNRSNPSEWYCEYCGNGINFDGSSSFKCPYGQVGDVLWVRETWQYAEDELGNDSSTTKGDCFGKFLYKANGDTPNTWKPSIFMPREACRIRLKTTDIRVERLQDISVDDAFHEGVQYDNVDYEALEGGELAADFVNYDWRDNPSYEDYYFPTFSSPVESFRSLWKSINGHESWNSNPFVWVISFEKIPSL